MKSLIVGMGIGGLYKSVLTTLGYEVITVDPREDKEADFIDVDSAIEAHKQFETVHICTPNFLHKQLTEQLAPVSKIVFVEKPGFKNSEEWEDVINTFPDTRIMMVKNNMWRAEIDSLKVIANVADIVRIEWIRKNCVPNPGSWFTNKELAFGGVSRDLMPHMLSLYIALNDSWEESSSEVKGARQTWNLEEIDSTEYGTINKDGIYDVDDHCILTYGKEWILECNWRSMSKENSRIVFFSNDNPFHVYELGWCPEEAYLNMIDDAVKNLNNNSYWEEQAKQDIWIHKQLEEL